jgi:hypothetical protein
MSKSTSFAKPLYFLLSLLAFVALVTGCVADDATSDDTSDEITAADTSADDTADAVDHTADAEALRAVLSEGGVSASARCTQSACAFRPSCRFPQKPRGRAVSCGGGKVSILCC